MSRRPPPEPLVKELPHPAEDLSADDDLLSWILVDQLGCLPNTKLGVHPQQVKFVGPAFKTDEVLSIVKETVTKGHIQQAMQRLQEFHLIKSHLASKDADSQRDRFIQHLRRYLLPYQPTSRLEIHLTARYSAVTGHTELAVFATRNMSTGVVLHELQGSVVPLPDQWREEMEIGEGFAVEAEGEEADSDVEDDLESLTDSQIVSFNRRDKGKGKELEPRRRSDRTKRRDFSIVWSSLKRCFQLFLGPARFLNHDCNPNVELLRQGKYVTFRTTRPVRVGDELTTFYGDSYFGPNNIECLCLSCEEGCKGGFTPKEKSQSREPSASVAPSNASIAGTPSRAKMRPPSSLRKVHNADDDSEVGTPTKSSNEIDVFTSGLDITKEEADQVEDSIAESDAGSTDPDSPPKRERLIRQATRTIKHWSFSKRPPKAVVPVVDEDMEDEEPEDFKRCATCCVPLFERVWYNGRYFDHCQRCIRHALIFELPWPAHRPLDVPEYPAHWLFPNSYIPRRIASYDLPSLSKLPKKKTNEPEPIVSDLPETKAERRARRFRTEIEREEYIVEQLREAAWSRQAAEELAQAEAEASYARKLAKVEAERARRAEEKRFKAANRIKGSGVWQFYEYVSPEVLRQRIEDKFKVTSGTRRGGRFRDTENEEEMKRLAEEESKKNARSTVVQEGLISPTNSSSSRVREEMNHSPLRNRAEASGSGQKTDADGDVAMMEAGNSSGPNAPRQSLPALGILPEAGPSTKPRPLARQSLPAKPKSTASPRRPAKKAKISHTPVASSSTNSSINGSETKRPRGRPKGSGHLQRAAAAKQAKLLAERRSEGSPSSSILVTHALESTSRTSGILSTQPNIASSHGPNKRKSRSPSPSTSTLPNPDQAEDIPSVDAASPPGSVGDGEVSVGSWSSAQVSAELLGSKDKGKGRMIDSPTTGSPIAKSPLVRISSPPPFQAFGYRVWQDESGVVRNSQFGTKETEIEARTERVIPSFRPLPEWVLKPLAFTKD